VAEERNVQFRIRVAPALAEAQEIGAALTAEEFESLMESVSLSKEAADGLVIDAMARARGFEGARRSGDTPADEEITE
jgi:hypothetical protein